MRFSIVKKVKQITEVVWVLIVPILIMISATTVLSNIILINYQTKNNFISRSAESRLYPHWGRPVASSSQFRQRRAAPAAAAAGSPGSSRPSPAAAGQIIPLTQPAEQLW